MTAATPTTTARPEPGKGVSFLLDFGPLLAFFVAYKLGSMAQGNLGGALIGTIVFMVCIAITLAVSVLRYRRVSPMTWLSALLIFGFGALTLYFRDPKFIQLKPTIIYAGFSVLLFAGLLGKRPLLKHLFGPVFEGLDEAGWIKLSRNWAIFFAAMALANEVMRATLSFDTWLTVKVWGMTIVSLLFGMANIPMLMRHGLLVTDPTEEPPTPPTSL